MGKAKAVMVLCMAIAIVLVAYTTLPAPHAHAYAVHGFSFNGMAYEFTMVATNQSEWQQGLMNYTVTNSTFELFEFGYSSDFPFWMKDTYYPLDIIWLEGNTVVYIANAAPCSWYDSTQSDCRVYDPGTFATAVIEARSGFVNSTGLKVGESVSFT